MGLKEEILLAKEALLKGEVVAFPTETVMGLGVVFNNYQAYSLLNKIKERPEDKPYTLMLKDKSEMSKYGIIDEGTQRVIDKFIPGSLTILVPLKKGSVPSYVTHDSDVIGMRVPTNIEALELLKAVNLPLLVPSANKSGSKPAVNSKEVKEIFKNEVKNIISGEAKGEVPSTIVSLLNGEVKVVRQGPISEEEIKKVYYLK
ncbi:MAG: threonylcarbamoyl-AMP synthase [Bacilli bacterium]|nr:threonylcarbamoyl-AMP synthase [Bacilli bacterium]